MIPTISVVVPTFNRRERLKMVLQAIGEQTYPLDRFEVIVVSDGSTDGSVEWLRGTEFPFAVTVIEQSNCGPASARNHGIAISRGELVLFIDDDVVPDSGLLCAHHQAHARLGDKCVVIGPMLTPTNVPLSPWVLWEQTMLYKQYEAMAAARWRPTARQFYTGNASLPRKALVDVGGFDTTFRRAEDVELAYRLADAGYQFEFEPNARAHHYAERPFASWLSIASSYGRSDAVMARDHGQPWLVHATREEFRRSHPLTRISVRATIGRPRLYAAASSAFRAMSALASRLHLPVVARYALSGLYNLAYYRAYVNELGSSDALFTTTKAIST